MGRIAAAAVILIAAGSTWLWVQRNGSPEIGKVEGVKNQEISAEGPRDNFMEAQSESPDAQVQSPEGQSSEVQSSEGQLSMGQAFASQSYSQEVSNTGDVQFTGQDALNAGGDEYSGQGSRSTLGEEMRMNRISRFSIPVEYSDAGTLHAMHTSREQMASVPGKGTEEDPETFEGIDVLEEFGDEKTNDYSKWAVGGQVTPLYSYRNVESSSEYAASTFSSVESYNDYESGILSYAGGLNVNYSPAKRLSLQSGLYYSRQGMSISNSYVTSYGGQSLSLSLPNNQLALNNSTGDIAAGGRKSNLRVSNLLGKFEGDQTSVDAYTPTTLGPEESPEVTQGNVLQQFEYLEIPLVARYRLIDRRLGLNLLGGLSTNFLVGNSVYFQEGDNKEYLGATADLKPINYSSVVGIGLQYSISRSFHINMEPTFRYYLNPINNGNGLRSHPYSLGFFTGISYSF